MSNIFGDDLVWFRNQFRILFPLNFRNKFLFDALVASMDREMTIQFAIDRAIQRCVNVEKSISEIQPHKNWKKKKPNQTNNKTNQTAIAPGKVDIITFTWQTAICNVVFDSLYFMWSPRCAML